MIDLSKARARVKTQHTVTRTRLALKSWLNRVGHRPEGLEQPLRAELLNNEQLRKHAIALAESHVIDVRGGPHRLLSRLDKNERVLVASYESIIHGTHRDRGAEPAAEWLLDNFHLIEEQIRTARRHLPKKYSKELPRLAGGASLGDPRVYDIALQLISHVDGKLDADALNGFVAAYQTILPLQLGELWAIPIMLRLALIENLRRVAVRIATDQRDRDHADRWADRLIETAEKEPRRLVMVVAEMAEEDPPLSSAFVAELSRRLHGQASTLALPLSWLEQSLSETGTSADQVAQWESQQQAADQVSIGNSIGSLRFLGATDWREFIESMSVVEHTLRADPLRIYASTDFATRDRCRHVVENIARNSSLDEPAVAQHAIALAQQALAEGAPARTHVGYYLLHDGVEQLETRCQMRSSIWHAIKRRSRHGALRWYLGAIGALTLAITGAALALAVQSGAGWALALVVASFVAIAGSQLAQALVNWLVPYVVTARPLPRMDYSEGIPDEARTLVVVPTLLTDESSTNDLLESVERHLLANRDANFQFALLTDFVDAPQAEKPADAELLAQARGGIVDLNAKYADDGEPFLLLHRNRKWNAQEGVWMGYERKRGKLDALSALLRGEVSSNSFSAVVGDTSQIRRVRYVITLDTDTQLPRDVARKLVATLDHPLNRPQVDRTTGTVREGYSILQPRVDTDPASAARSRFARLFGGEPGIDPYTRVVSDVYQDLFGEGSYIGKGIYDVDAFHTVLAGRLPENLILSHDLLESCYARSALVSDVQLYEGYPARYLSDASRRHRWIRGDWQIAQWLLPKVPSAHAGKVPNPLTGLARWKIFDNLRRSLAPIAYVVLLFVSATVMTPAWLWTLAVVLAIVAPHLLGSLPNFFRKPPDLTWRLHLRPALQDLRRHAMQAGILLAMLPYDAYSSLDAIVRTGVRLLVTRKRLLEWRAARETEQATRSDLFGVARTLWIGPAIGCALLGLIAVVRPAFSWALAIVPLLWCAGPLIAWSISRPMARRQSNLDADSVTFLHGMARRTWRFFETFVGPEDNWLPPDNYQEYPVGVIAHRTSPTNIGLSLLANLAAHDFGYLSTGALLQRTGATLDSLDKLERFRGHFYNWYDTRSCRPLLPQYVSTVDSGNLAAHALTLQAGLAELAGQQPWPQQLVRGLADTVAVMRDIGTAMSRETPGKSPAVPAGLAAQLEDLRIELQPAATTLAQYYALLNNARQAAGAISESLAQHPHEEITAWATALLAQAADAVAEVEFLNPWLTLPNCDRCLSQGTTCHARHCPEHGATAAAMAELDAVCSLSELATLSARLGGQFAVAESGDKTTNPIAITSEVPSVSSLVRTASERAQQRLDLIERTIGRLKDCVKVEYDFLYDHKRNLLAIGYNVDQRRRDQSFYDLLASEARLASFLGIADGELSAEHWFALGRLLTTVCGHTALLSWSGSMFEYLMPLLVMPLYEDTLLGQSCYAAVDRQIEYGEQRGVPWGISESGYNITDAQLNYQYKAFGVPGLGLQPGLAEDLVIAPYATMLALLVAPRQACENLRRMQSLGYLGQYGYYEAVDFTPSRLANGETSAIVRSYMAHHQGMSFLSLASELLARPMQRRFESLAAVRAHDLLLHERIPQVAPLFPHAADTGGTVRQATERESLIRLFRTPHTPTPEVKLLSNGRYHVMVTNAGGGYSRWKDMAVTRWREDTTRDDRGTFCYLRDLTTGHCWSTAYQPTRKSADLYEAIFTLGRAEFRRRDGEIETHCEIAVSPEDDVEVRRVSITNRSRVPHTLELTTYAEVVLTTQAADLAHPAFSNLFVQTEIQSQMDAILCTRRPRSAQDATPWMLHLMTCHGQCDGESTFETDRLQFLGRGQSASNPAALQKAGPLGGSQGSVLDPAVAIRRRLTIQPDTTVVVDVVTGIAESRIAAIALVQKYRDLHLAERVFDLANTHDQVMMQQLSINQTEAQDYERLASSLIYPHAERRASARLLQENRRGQSGLWGYGISGDLPIVLVRIADGSNVELVRQVVQAHAYWRSKGLAVDLVIWNEDASGYRQDLYDQIMGLVAGGTEAQLIDRPGGVFVRRADQISHEDRILLQTVARAILVDSGGTLADQLTHRTRPEPTGPAIKPSAPREPVVSAKLSLPPDLRLCNGTGGFSADGREYLMLTSQRQRTPLPWSNVLANPEFGSVISESGGAYSWSENAHEFRLTPWHNDPATDAAGEAFYLRDEETGNYWSPTPLPAGGDASYLTRHGFGYSTFECSVAEIASTMTTFVAIDAPVKFIVVRVRNNSDRRRKLSLYGYVEWVLAESRAQSLMHVGTEIDSQSGALFARNRYNSDFGDRVAFFETNETGRQVCGDRTEFLGRGGALDSPAALKRVRLSGKVGAGLDPCGAIQVSCELAPRAEREFVFILGAGKNEEEARRLVQVNRTRMAAQSAFDAVRTYWQETLGAVSVKTPDETFNLLANGWLTYQVLSCRVWGRSGYYQSGGAFGFRDQLQDVMALVHCEPRLVRSHLLLAASHQFHEGDVQHWWHPPTRRGVRTHISDDYLWLPYVTCHYVTATGDSSVLDEPVSYLEGRPVKPEEDAYYDLPGVSEEQGTLYEHCVRAILHGLRLGEHGLPLMGTGDWNDGMNLVGHEGRGESVWLGFFLCDVLSKFVVVAQGRGDGAFAEQCATARETLAKNLEEHAWDGNWYLRAFFDDGRPLGSSKNDECQIDSLPQSWATISGVAPDSRAIAALGAVDARLVRRQARLVQLFDPPFNHSDLDPGYIKGYVPGVRENGGQYTHAAVWTVIALAERRDPRAWEIFSLINPLCHAAATQDVATYMVEPYVVAADVYAAEGHVGRGGWTWYTGSASWMYRLMIESLLGIQLRGNRLMLKPFLPDDWPGFEASYRYRDTTYAIQVRKVAGPTQVRVTLDGQDQAGNSIPLVNDKLEHVVEIKC